MNLINPTKLVAGYTMATDKTGREWLVVVAKGTFGFPERSDGDAPLLEDQVPLIETDEFTGAPALSAPRCELDFAPRKPRCDVLLSGSCHAPGGQPATSVPVALRVGVLSKAFNVIGQRTWQASLLHKVAPSAPRAFTAMPLSYDKAYGGIDRPTEEPSTHRWYPSNHVGVGYRPKTPADRLIGQPLPNTEELGNPIVRPDGMYRPMAFGPVGRAWEQRIRWAGTYDDKWKKDQYPFLPGDFDERYFQCAPEDQQIDHLQGGETVVLLNLTPEGRTQFKLPRLAEPFDFLYKNGDAHRVTGVVDTLMLEPELRRFTLSLRASVAIKRSLHELHSVELGRVLRQPVPDDDEPQVPVAKPHYKSLADLTAARRTSKRNAGS